MNILGAVLGFVTKPIEILLKTRQAKKAAEAGMLSDLVKAETEAKIIEIKSKADIAAARAQLKAKQAEHEANWEVAQVQNAMSSWKDEYLTVIISIPLLITFLIPVLAAMVGTEDAVMRIQYAIEGGWELLGKAPQEYWYLTAASFAASFGLKGLAQFWSK